MLKQSMIAIQNLAMPGYVVTVVLLFLWGYSCLSSQIDATGFNWDFMVHEIMDSIDKIIMNQ